MKSTYEGKSGRVYKVVGQRNCRWDERRGDFRLNDRGRRGYVYLVGNSVDGRECGFEVEIFTDGNSVAREIRGVVESATVEL